MKAEPWGALGAWRGEFDEREQYVPGDVVSVEGTGAIYRLELPEGDDAELVRPRWVGIAYDARTTP